MNTRKPIYHLRDAGFRVNAHQRARMESFGRGVALNLGDPEGHKVYLEYGAFPTVYAGHLGGQNQQAVLLVRKGG